MIKNNVLSCIDCRADLVVFPHTLSCAHCKREFSVVGERVFFINHPKDVSQSAISEKEKTNKSKWSTWRKLNYGYYQSHLQGVSRESVLCDVGAGPLHFKDLFLSFSAYIGVDFWPFEHVSVVTDITKTLPIKSGTIDVVILSNVLEHISTPHELIKECSRILKSGGKIIGTVPFLINVHQAPYDFLRYTHFMLQALLVEADFVDAHVDALGAPLDVYGEMQNLFFGEALGSYTETQVGGYMLRVAVRFFRKIELYIFRSMCLLRFGQKTTPFFTSGYGFVGIKK